MDRTTLTANLKPLERRGLVESRTDPADRRERLLLLTAAGRSLLQAAVPIWRRTHSEADRALTDPAVDAPALRPAPRAQAHRLATPKAEPHRLEQRRVGEGGFSSGRSGGGPE